MGNSFEKESRVFQSNAQKISPPHYLATVIREQFRSPFQVFRTIKRIVAQYLNVSYLMKKKEFLAMVHEVFGLEPAEDGKKLYKMFRVRNPQGVKVVNVLEVLSTLILNADFGHTNEKDLLHNAELIEHKMNLILILFDFRESARVNVVEVMIMARTIMQGFAKLYPQVKFFSNTDIVEEIRPQILALFSERIEAELKAEQAKSPSSTKKTHNIAEERALPDIFSKKTTHGLGSSLGSAGPGMGGGFGQQKPMRRMSNDGITDERALSSLSTASAGSGRSAASTNHDDETLAQKKQRLFKWNHFQNIKLDIDFVKQQLLKNANFVRFVSFFSNFDSVTMAWGCNHWFQ
jgi:hypothetical protein